MLKRLAFLCLMTCAALSAGAAKDESSWLTVVGSVNDPDSDTILIDPKPLESRGHLRSMTMRLNRAKQRTSTDGIVFRSFVAVVEFDCDKRTARFTKTQFFEGPLWTAPGKAVNYPATMVRPMAFREFEPNPRERVIRAACYGTGYAAGRVKQ